LKRVAFVTLHANDDIVVFMECDSIRQSCTCHDLTLVNVQNKLY